VRFRTGHRYTALGYKVQLSARLLTEAYNRKLWMWSRDQFGAVQPTPMRLVVSRKAQLPPATSIQIGEPASQSSVLGGRPGTLETKNRTTTKKAKAGSKLGDLSREA
jgi:hypothetical protein